MKISRKGRYALRTLIYFAMNGKEKKITLNHVAKANGISVKYLEQIYASLRRAGIVKSEHGINGGYILNKAPEKITVEEILDAVEGDYRIEAEEISKDCLFGGISEIIQTRVIDEINDKTGEVISNLTLQDLVDDYNESCKAVDEMYYI